jgi:phospho-N-acetylmuramoyl-pentapeptide-transferase
MLHKLLLDCFENYKLFNLLKYLTFRTMGSLITAMLVSFIFGGPLIKFLKQKQKEGQPIRDDGPASHLITKKGTPTMGGLLILTAMVFSTLLWGDLSNHYIWIVLGVTLGYGFLGALDDYKKLTKRNHKGVSGRFKLVVQSSIALLASIFITSYSPEALANTLAFPFIKDFTVDFGVFFYLWAILVIVGSSNAVNLTDGLDGLAIMPAIIASVCFCIISYLVGNIIFSNYLQIHHIPNTGELCVLLGSLIGAGLGFLWFNAPPAKIFMGDTGSLAVGGTLGSIAVITKHEIVLSIVGGLFVIEAISVILQVGYYKMTKKRIFLMAPIHHHFEKKGWEESTIVIRFWIIATILGIIGLSTLKIR